MCIAATRAAARHLKKLRILQVMKKYCVLHETTDAELSDSASLSSAVAISRVWRGVGGADAGAPAGGLVPAISARVGVLTPRVDPWNERKEEHHY